MQSILALLVLLLGIALVVVAIVYQILDKFRFYCRRQWPALEPLISEWLGSAEVDCAQVEGFSAALDLYRAAKQPEKKLNAFMELAGLCPRSEERRDIEKRLETEAGKYNEYVRVYNKRFDLAPIGKVGALLGFRRLRSISFD